MPSAWSALADPHRREMLTLLLERPRPVGELVQRLGLTQPGTSKHLRVLREAGLVQVRKEAQRRVYAVEPRPLAELDAWLAPYRRLWDERLDALERHLDRTRTTKED
ncbi:MAG TPA: metalloregulator ArsR/SmtB family transcription factor [Solirubrobacteraceae bacterium]